MTMILPRSSRTYFGDGARAMLPASLAQGQHQLIADDAPLHNFQTLPSDLATVTKNCILRSTKDPVIFDVVTTPTPVQQQAFDLLKVKVMTVNPRVRARIAKTGHRVYT